MILDLDHCPLIHIPHHQSFNRRTHFTLRRVSSRRTRTTCLLGSHSLVLIGVGPVSSSRRRLLIQPLLVVTATVNVRNGPSTQVVSSRKRLPSHQSFHPVPLMEMAAASKVSLLTNASKSSSFTRHPSHPKNANAIHLPFLGWVMARAKARSLFSRNEKATMSTPEIEMQEIEAPAKLRKKRDQAPAPPVPRIPSPTFLAPAPVPSEPHRPTRKYCTP